MGFIAMRVNIYCKMSVMKKQLTDSSMGRNVLYPSLSGLRLASSWRKHSMNYEMNVFSHGRYDSVTGLEQSKAVVNSICVSSKT